MSEIQPPAPRRQSLESRIRDMFIVDDDDLGEFASVGERLARTTFQGYGLRSESDAAAQQGEDPLFRSVRRHFPTGLSHERRAMFERREADLAARREQSPAGQAEAATEPQAQSAEEFTAEGIVAWLEGLSPEQREQVQDGLYDVGIDDDDDPDGDEASPVEAMSEAGEEELLAGGDGGDWD